MRLPRLLLVLLLAAAPAHAEDPPRKRADAPSRVGLVRLSADGAYRLQTAQLARVGIADAGLAEIRRGGTALPLLAGSRVGLGDDTLLFAARNTASGSSRFAVYEIWRRATPRDAPAGDPPYGAYRPREVATDRILGELAAADVDTYEPRNAQGAPADVPVWFLGFAPPGQMMPVDLGPLGATRGTPQMLEAVVYGTWVGPVAMEARWGGHVLGRAQAEHAVGGRVLRWTVPADAVPQARARLELTNVSPPPPLAPARDVSAHRGTIFVDRVRLDGDGSMLHRWKDARPVEIEPAGAPADPLARAGAARHVIVATPPLREAAAALARHRTQHGIPSAVVPVTEIYDRYGHGEHAPLALRRFLDDLARRPNAPLEYVLLAGDATWNRTDLLKEATIPAPMARTMYNGATAADRLYTRPAGTHADGPSIGRLPFRRAEALRAYVERLIRYETQPPAVPSRRLLRFVTSEGRFGAFIDNIIEGRFRNIVANKIPLAYDIEVTFASTRSNYFWPPPEFNDKVLAGLNDGALFLTYVGHGFAQGFDTLHVGAARHPILHVRDAPRVEIAGTPPIVCVLACTTASFDDRDKDGIGEALMKRPHGPIAYWGATRICHPGFNALMGEALAPRMTGRDGPTRLGPILDAARDHTLDPDFMKFERGVIAVLAGKGVSTRRLAEEGALMYTLLGDPALAVAFPRYDLEVEGRIEEQDRGVHVEVRGPLPAGTAVHVTLERPRNKPRAATTKVTDPSDPATFAAIRANHDSANNLLVAGARGVLGSAGKLRLVLALTPGDEPHGLILKAWAVAGGEIHQGATKLP